MQSSEHETWLLTGVIAAFGVIAVAVVLGITTGWWSPGGSDSEATLRPIDDGDGPTGLDARDANGRSTGSLFLITPTPNPAGPASSAPADPAATPSSSATSVPATAEIDAAPGRGRAPAAPFERGADAGFEGRWRVADTVTEGANAGRTYTFDVALSQQDNRVAGGNSGIQISGTVQGDTATLEYVQPALGLRGTFVWTMVSPDQAAGTFTNSYPNAGTSTLQRLR